MDFFPQPVDRSPILDDEPAEDVPIGRQQKKLLVALLNAVQTLAKEGPDIKEPGSPYEAHNTGSRRQPDFPAQRGRTDEYEIDAFRSFDKKVTNIRQELTTFVSAITSLARPVRIVEAVNLLYDHLERIRVFFRSNTHHLYPHAVKMPRAQKAAQHTSPRKARQKLGTNRDAIESQLEDLADIIVEFRESLMDVRYFRKQTEDASLELFEHDLDYWSNYCRQYQGRLQERNIQSYMHDMMGEISIHLDNLLALLTGLVRVGVPTVSNAQTYQNGNFLALTAVATLFSGITATTLQFSYQLTSTKLDNAVNALWFSSLVLSIVAVINSLMGLTWNEAIFMYPENRIPWWVVAWIRRSPLGALVGSTVAYAVGLVLFVYSSGQSRVTTLFTLIFTSFSAVALVAVTIWFALEWRKFKEAVLRQKDLALSTHWQKRRWGADEAMTVWPTAMTIPQIPIVDTILQEVQHRKSNSPATIPNTATIPTVNVTPIKVATSREIYGGPVEAPLARSSSYFEGKGRLIQKIVVDPLRPFKRSHSMQSNRLDGQVPLGPFLGISSPDPIAPPTPVVPVRPVNPIDLREIRKMEPSTPIQSDRLAPIADIAFSPKGDLAVASWGKVTHVHPASDAGSGIVQHQPLSLPQREGFVVQVAWSPSSEYLLTRCSANVKLWKMHNSRAECVGVFNRRDSKYVTWRTNNIFLSLEGAGIMQIDRLQGSLSQSISERMVPNKDVLLQWIAVLPESGGNVVVALGTFSPQDAPRRRPGSKREKELIVFDIRSRKLVYKQPILADDINVVLAQDGSCCLINRDGRASRLLQIDISSLQSSARKTSTPLMMERHDFTTLEAAEFAGPGCFGGTGDEFVLRAAKSGAIYIWNRETGDPLHSLFIPTPMHFGSITSMAWHHFGEHRTPVLAAAHHDLVELWVPKPTTAMDQIRSGHGKVTAPSMHERMHTDPGASGAARLTVRTDIGPIYANDGSVLNVERP